MYKVLVDSNIFVDFMFRRMPFYNDSEKVISLIENKKVKGYVTTSMLMDLHYIFKRLSHSNANADLAIQEILKVFDCIDISKKDIVSTLENHHHDFEDCVIENCANRYEVDYIVTRNCENFECSKTKIVCPSELLNIV